MATIQHMHPWEDLNFET